MPDPAKRWLTFLRNHKEAIAAIDFFTVSTVTFSLLYGFFLISHDRRRILHFNVTKHPTTQWIIQQFREAFPFDSAPRFLIFDRDAKQLAPWSFGVVGQARYAFPPLPPVTVFGTCIGEDDAGGPAS